MLLPKSYQFTALGLFLPFIAIHITNICCIAQKKLYKNSTYLLLLNISISDIMFAIVFNMGVHISSYHELVRCIYFAFWYPSVTATLLSSIDRFIAIRYCLRYVHIMKKSRLYILIAAGWFLSISFGMFPYIEERNMIPHAVYRLILYIIVVHSCSIMLTAFSAYIIFVKRKHLRRIQKLNQCFGTTHEPFHRLVNLQRSITDVLKLNIITVVLIEILFILQLVYRNANDNNIVEKSLLVA